ncbi:CRE-COL-68 protein, partial [Aphelenchoides avenae]
RNPNGDRRGADALQLRTVRAVLAGDGARLLSSPLRRTVERVRRHDRRSWKACRHAPLGRHDRTHDASCSCSRCGIVCGRRWSRRLWRSLQLW